MRLHVQFTQDMLYSADVGSHMAQAAQGEIDKHWIPSKVLHLPALSLADLVRDHFDNNKHIACRKSSTTLLDVPKLMPKRDSRTCQSQQQWTHQQW